MNSHSNHYPSTKFNVLSDDERLASAKKNYFVWIITGTLLFLITVAYFSFKIFMAHTFFNDEKPHSHIINNTYITVDQLKNCTLYNPGPLLAGLKKKSQRIRNEFSGEETTTELETIPLLFVEQMLGKDFENLQDFINLDLLLYYENLMSKVEPKSLKLIFNEIQSKLLLVKNPRDFVNFLGSLKSNKFKFYVNLLKQEKYNLKLQHFEDFFALTGELNYWYNYLHRLSDFLSIYEQQKFRKNLENCTEKNFGKFTEKTQKLLFSFVYSFKITERKIKEINEIINMWSKPITAEFFKCSMILYNKVLLLSDLNEEIQRLNAPCLKCLYVFASHIIYLDSDLELFGVNLAIVAPKWVFLKKTKINLNGISGKEFKNETASFNKSGLPGNPGGNAGDFFGIGNPQGKFLVISANGGNGGKGQNGAIGLDGINYSRPRPPISRPACISKINTYKNVFGQTITHYKIFSSFGCGGSGTDGGVGGTGGRGGVITLISDSIKITKGLNGMNGSPGKGGAGGIGGQNGCYYEVLDVDDETLHPITKVKCPTGNTLPSGKYGKDNYNSQGQISLAKKENLTAHSTLYHFFRYAGKDFIENNDLNIISFLNNSNQFLLYNETCIRDIVTEYKLLEVFNKIEFYEIYKEKLLKYMQNYPDYYQSVFKYLLSAVLGRILILKENAYFFFIDHKNFLNLVERNIKTTNDLTHELQSIFYYKEKVYNRIKDIKMNLNQIKIRSTSHVSFDKNPKEELFMGNNSKYLQEEFDEKVFHIAITTNDVLSVLLDSILGDPKQMKYNEILKLFLQRTTHYKSNKKILNKSPVISADIILINTLENLKNNNSREVRGDISNLMNALCILKESGVFSHHIKNLLETLTDEMEHFLAVYPFLEWEESRIYFFKSLESLTLNLTSNLEEQEEIQFLKNQLVDALVTLQCKLAFQSSGLNLNSVENIPICQQLLHSKKISSPITDNRSLLQNLACEDANSLCKNHFKAVFDKNSAVGEFYHWSNNEIREKLKNLFSGAEINLKSDIINHHVFDKNFIQFRSLKLDFETESMSQKNLHEVLSYFKIEMTHSGYSYYNWKEETYVFVSEKVKLEYSFRVQSNGEPEVYNSLYKKCQDGEIKLSPFTTWTLRLLPIKDRISFSELMPFADTVNLRLIGTGTYIS